MITGLFKQSLLLRIERELNVDMVEANLLPIHGGDSHAAYRLDSSSEPIFLKANKLASKEVLASEYHSLCLIAQTPVADLYPQPLFFIEHEGMVVMGMTFLPMVTVDNNNGSASAKGLIKQHQVLGSSFGWPVDNFIGHSKQINGYKDDWLTFFREHRLLPQLKWATDKGLDIRLQSSIESIVERLHQFLPASIPPSLLHGDLWNGNIGHLPNKKTVCLFDPAPYYGDPESDIAMTKLFGQLPDSFYSQYRDYYPEPENELELHSVYNLYHAMNHFNLFGAGYEAMVSRFTLTLV